MPPIEESVRNICNLSDATTMKPNDSSPMHPEMSISSEEAMKDLTASTPATGHMMPANNPDNPQNWPLYKKVYASAVAFAFAWVV